MKGRLEFTRDLNRAEWAEYDGETPLEKARKIELARKAVVIELKDMKGNLRAFVRAQDEARRRGVPLICPPEEHEGILDPTARREAIAKSGAVTKSAAEWLDVMRRAEREPEIPTAEDVTRDPEAMDNYRREKADVAAQRARLGMPTND